MHDPDTQAVCGSLASYREVEFIAPTKSKMATKFDRVLPFEDLNFGPKPTLSDVAAYLRPGKNNKVGYNIFEEKRLKSLADEEGVEWWGWNVQNKCPGAENKWVFVAVQKV